MSTIVASGPTPAIAPAWNRSPERLSSKTFSAGSKEFVPSWGKKPEAVTVDIGNTPVQTKAFRATASEFVPRSLRSEPGQALNSDVKQPRAFRAAAPEYVPPCLARTSSEGDATAASDPSKDRRAEKLCAVVSASTLSTSEGSGSDSSSDASASSTSRSHSPVPAPPTLQEVQQGEPKLGLASLSPTRPADVATPTQFPDKVVAKPSPATPVAQEDKSWRNVSAAKPLQVSETSWAGRQRARRSSQLDGEVAAVSDEEIVRSMKSILNKLTVEKFDSLSGQILKCGICTAAHLELLIQEIFEKATTQHHFIDMYADLCALLNKSSIVDASKANFKKILLNNCQASFEKHLTPPSKLTELDGEEKTAAAFLYKMQMLGNIRFVGALLVRKMLASKVMFAIMEEMLQDPTPEALETLAAFLMVVGPTFDNADWVHSATLNAIFKQVETFAKKASVSSRVRCLLKDVLDVRKAGWKDRRPKKIDGPLKLEQVAVKAAIENGNPLPASTTTSCGDDWAVVGGTRASKAASQVHGKPIAPCEPVPSSRFLQLSQKIGEKKAEKKNKVISHEASKKKDKHEAVKQAAAVSLEPKAALVFDEQACRGEISATLAELRVSHDVQEAIVRIADIAIPVSQQASELCAMLGRLSEEGSQDVRKVGFRLVVGLFIDKHWKSESAANGVRQFVDDTCADLKCDVPALPKILRDELHPALEPLVKAKMLGVELHDSLMAI